jgi:hypothetical protein
VHKNGFNPIWKEEFNFELQFPDLCFAVFSIVTKSKVKNFEIARNAIPVIAICEGIRVIELFDAKLEVIPDSFLLLRIQKKVLVAN